MGKKETTERILKVDSASKEITEIIMSITLTKIKTHLNGFSKSELIREITALLKTYPHIKEYYQAKIVDEGQEELLAKYKSIIKDELTPDYPPPTLRLSIARAAVRQFIKLVADDVLKAEIMVYYAEQGVACTLEYGDINEPFYVSIESMYEQAAEFIKNHDLKTEFSQRMQCMVHGIQNIGWGFHDSLKYLYEKYFSPSDA